MDINEITYKIRGAIYDVYKILGPGLLESVYEEALVMELELRGLSVERQKHVPLVYKGKNLKTSLCLDLLVENEVIVELKSVTELLDIHKAQVKNYLALTGLELGLLYNFNELYMRPTRVLNPNDPANAKKPEQIIEKMVQGKLKKFYATNCLTEQEYVKDGSLTVGKYVASVAKEMGEDFSLSAFVLYEKGEGLEKKEDDFADEVARLTQK